MLKRIQSRLLTHYPQLWNTRIALVLPLILLIHIIFYFGGYFRPFELADLHSWGYFRYDGVTMLSVLVTALIIILWLLFYLRNNPLKAGYQISRYYLLKEFLLLMLIFFASSTFFLTYQQGLTDQVNRVTQSIDVKEELDLANFAFHYIATDADEFRIYRSCDSTEARQKRTDARLDIYYQKRDAGEDVRDYVVESEPFNPNLDTLPMSYLYYCKLRFSLDVEKEPILPTSADIHSLAHSYLINGNKEAVLAQLTGLKDLLSRYEISNNFDPNTHLEWIFKSPNFEVDTFYSTSLMVYDEYQQKELSQAYIAYTDIETTLERILSIRSGFWNSLTLLLMFYYAFGMALLLLSFRMTSIRVWFTGIIGSGIVAILFSIVVVSLDSTNANLTLYFALYAASLLGAVWLMRAAKKKFLSGVLYLWAMMMQLSILPIATGWAMDYYRKKHNISYSDYVQDDYPIYHWIQEHVQELFALNLLIMLVLLLAFYFPMARKWQANPEE